MNSSESFPNDGEQIQQGQGTIFTLDPDVAASRTAIVEMEISAFTADDFLFWAQRIGLCRALYPNDGFPDPVRYGSDPDAYVDNFLTPSNPNDSHNILSPFFGIQKDSVLKSFHSTRHLDLNDEDFLNGVRHLKTVKAGGEGVVIIGEAVSIDTMNAYVPYSVSELITGSNLATRFESGDRKAERAVQTMVETLRANVSKVLTEQDGIIARKLSPLEAVQDTPSYTTELVLDPIDVGDRTQLAKSTDMVLQRKRRYLKEIVQAQHSLRRVTTTLGLYVDNNRMYEDIEFYQSSDLVDLISAAPGKRLSVRTAANTIAQVAVAILDSSNTGIIHRDLKPGNLLVGRGINLANVKQIDFGLARSGDQSQDITRDGQILGTPNYMSPEQAVNEDVLEAGGSVDVFAAGLVFEQMLTGKLRYVTPGDKMMKTLMDRSTLYNRRNTPEVVVKPLRLTPKRFPEAETDLRLRKYLEEAAEVIERMTHPNFKHRYHNKGELEQLVSWCFERSDFAAFMSFEDFCDANYSMEDIQARIGFRPDTNISGPEDHLKELERFAAHVVSSGEKNWLDTKYGEVTEADFVVESKEDDGEVTQDADVSDSSFAQTMKLNMQRSLKEETDRIREDAYKRVNTIKKWATLALVLAVGGAGTTAVVMHQKTAAVESANKDLDKAYTALLNLLTSETQSDPEAIKAAIDEFNRAYVVAEASYKATLKTGLSAETNEFYILKYALDGGVDSNSVVSHAEKQMEELRTYCTSLSASLQDTPDSLDLPEVGKIQILLGKMKSTPYADVAIAEQVVTQAVEEVSGYKWQNGELIDEYSIEYTNAASALLSALSSSVNISDAPVQNALADMNGTIEVLVANRANAKQMIDAGFISKLPAFCTAIIVENGTIALVHTKKVSDDGSIEQMFNFGSITLDKNGGLQRLNFLLSAEEGRSIELNRDVPYVGNDDDQIKIDLFELHPKESTDFSNYVSKNGKASTKGIIGHCLSDGKIYVFVTTLGAMSFTTGENGDIGSVEFYPSASDLQKNSAVVDIIDSMSPQFYSRTDNFDYETIFKTGFSSDFTTNFAPANLAKKMGNTTRYVELMHGDDDYKKFKSRYEAQLGDRK